MSDTSLYTRIFISEVVSASIAVVIEAILIITLINIGRWNYFNKLICLISALDVVLFISLIIYRIIWYETNPSVFIDFPAWEMLLLCLSAISSLLIEYQLVHLLKYKQIFVLQRDHICSMSTITISVLIPITLYILTTIFINKDHNKFDPDSLNYKISATSMHILTLYTLLIILVNFGLFLQSSYLSKFQNRMGRHYLENSNAQKVIDLLVKRMKYFPIIQTLLFFVLTTLQDSYGIPELSIIYFFPPLGYLILFFRMNSAAWNHVKRKFGIDTRTSTSTASPQATIADLGTSAAGTEESRTDPTSGAESSRVTRVTAYRDAFEDIEDDELINMIQSYHDERDCLDLELPNSYSNNTPDYNNSKEIINPITSPETGIIVENQRIESSKGV
jgi:hypothetical protein